MRQGFDNDMYIRKEWEAACLDRLQSRVAAFAWEALPDGRVLTTRGTMEGRIAYEPAGAGGFGYDPILMLPEYGKTSAEITMEEKNAISQY